MIKNLLLSAAVVAAAGVTASAAGSASAERLMNASTVSVPRSEAFKYAPTFHGQRAMPGKSLQRGRTNAAGPRKAAAATDNVLANADDFNYLNAPDGSLWFYTVDYDYEVIQEQYFTRKNIAGWHFTIYNSKLEEIAAINGTATLGENETAVASVDLGADVTQKFFNTDSYYEFMVMVATNTTMYTNNYRTYVYTSNPSVTEPIAEMPGYYVSAVNSATDSYSENFFITFMEEDEAEQTEIGGVMNVMDYKLSLYKKAGYGGGPQLLKEFRIPGVTVSGPDAVFLVATAHGGRAYFALNHLKYSYYEDPYDYENENITADNELIIKLYSMGSYGSLTEECTTTVPVPEAQPGNPYTFVYLGGFSYDGDICFDRYSTGNTPTYIITKDHYLSIDADIYDYEVYATDGTKLHTIAEGVDTGLFMSDIAGADPQIMFVKTENGGTVFDFVNLTTTQKDFTLQQNAGGVALTTSIDRTPYAGSYAYAASLSSAHDDAQGNAIHSIGWFDAEGHMMRTDDINLGKNVSYAQVYIEGKALSPYAFNTDALYDYMFLIKRATGNASAIQEQLDIINTEGKSLLTCSPDDTYGNIISVWPVELGTASSMLTVVYQSSDDKLSALFYNLPLDKFAGGDGTAGNPYLIATAGDLQQIASDPAACYKLTADIDAAGFDFYAVSSAFTGTLDGDGHSVDGLNVGSGSMFSSLGQGAEIKNITFNDPVCGTGSPAFLVKNAMGAKLTGVTLRRLSMTDLDEDAYGDFGALVYRASNSTEITLCSVLNATLDLPGYSVGGIVCQLYTSSSISACAFTGTIVGSSQVGGIVSTDMNAGTIANCHVKADIKAQNTVGGIIGSSSRGTILNCHVEGSIAATEAARWGGGLKAGGIAGELAPAIEDTEEYGAMRAVDNTGGVIAGCVVNLTSFTGAEVEGEGEYATQNNTMHRIVGKSRVNEEPEYLGYDEDWNPIYGDPQAPEAALKNNYAVGIDKVDDTVADDHTSTEGATAEFYDLGTDFFENLGFVYGETADAPWDFASFRNPALYTERGRLEFTPDHVMATVGEPVWLTLTAVTEKSITLDQVLEDFLCDVSDESAIYMTGNADTEGNSLKIEFMCEKEGTFTVTAGFGGLSAKATVEVKLSGISDVAGDAAAGISYDGTIVRADGSTIELFNVAGLKVAEGFGAVSTASLPCGVYVARTSSAALKIAVK